MRCQGADIGWASPGWEGYLFFLMLINNLGHYEELKGDKAGGHGVEGGAQIHRVQLIMIVDG